MVHRGVAGWPRLLLSFLPTSSLSGIEGAEAGEEGFEAAPDGLPAGFAIALAAQEAAQAGEGAEEVADGVEGAGASEDLAEAIGPARWHDFRGGAIGSCAGDEFHLQQSHSQHGDQADDRLQSLRGEE